MQGVFIMQCLICKVLLISALYSKCAYYAVLYMRYTRCVQESYKVRKVPGGRGRMRHTFEGLLDEMSSQLEQEAKRHGSGKGKGNRSRGTVASVRPPTRASAIILDRWSSRVCRCVCHCAGIYVGGRRGILA